VIPDTKLWDEAERLFREADLSRPEGERFEKWSDQQDAAFMRWRTIENQRMLVFYPTGTGKSKLTLGIMHAEGVREINVIAPKNTHASWRRDMNTLGITGRVETHAKFRMEATKYKRDTPFIIDEFHELGGHDKLGFKKLNRMATKMTGPLILASATPNYNDAERVFCLTAVLEERPNRNYLNWIVENCVTEPNHFSMIPNVVGFRHYDGALDFLVSQSYTAYVEDTAVWTPVDFELPTLEFPVFEDYGYDERTHRMVASDMEKRHKRVNLRFIADDGYIRDEIWDAMIVQLYDLKLDDEKLFIFCNHKTVAEALHRLAVQGGFTFLITGDTKDVHLEKTSFINVQHSAWLIGTTAIATGVDGIDKVCRAMLILDDIEGDPSKRRQLIGRILPRGTDDGRERIVVTARFK
jgi:hypothetical protein